MSEQKKEKCRQIGGITLCKECDAMYWGTPEGFVRDFQESAAMRSQEAFHHPQR